MRKVFSTVRLENAEGVAALLRERGIEVKITNGRSYKGGRRRGFSYRESALAEVPEAAVWVVHPDDQPQARALLREAGLMDSTRDSFLPESAAPAAPRPANVARRVARVRVILLAAIVALVMLNLARSCQHQAPPQATPQTPEPAPSAKPDSERHIVPVDLSLD